MARKRLSADAPCPCGSGRPYGECCWGKSFEWLEDEQGTVFKAVPIRGELKELLQEWRQ